MPPTVVTRVMIHLCCGWDSRDVVGVNALSEATKEQAVKGNKGGDNLIHYSRTWGSCRQRQECHDLVHLKLKTESCDGVRELAGANDCDIIDATTRSFLIFCQRYTFRSEHDGV